jgi:glycosyltransferase involved in cell wall biosynthesis
MTDLAKYSLVGETDAPVVVGETDTPVVRRRTTRISGRRSQDLPARSSLEDMRFAFVTIGAFSGINERVLERLNAELPEFEVHHFDIPSWVRSRRRILAGNLLHVLAEHGTRPFTDRARLWGPFYRTSFMFRSIQREMSARLARGRYAFTFQTQSLFDASVAGTPHFVYTDHTELVNRRYPDFNRALASSESWISRERQIYEHATLNFTMSSHVSRSLVEQYGVSPARVRCVLAGSNVPRSDLIETEPDYASKRVLFVGRDWERKGGPDLISAFQLARKHDPQLELVIAGCTPELAVDGVEVLGELSPERVREQYAKAALFCMPSLIEPFGVVFVEALTSGLPVVATAIGALPDIVQNGDTGYLLAPHDVQGLARSLNLLLSDPDRCRRFGERGRAYVRERYTWDRTAAKMAEQIRTAI